MNPLVVKQCLFLQRLQLVAVLGVQHGPAGGGQLLAEGVGAGEILGLLRGPAFFGEGGDGCGCFDFGGLR